MIKIIQTAIVIRSFFAKAITWISRKCLCLSAEAVVSEITGNTKKWLLGEFFEPKLSTFSKNNFPLPQSTYFVIAPNHYFVIESIHAFYFINNIVLYKVSKLVYRIFIVNVVSMHLSATWQFLPFQRS